MTLTQKEQEIVFQLAEKLTGSSQQGLLRKEIIIRNVEKRITEKQVDSFEGYLKLVKTNEKEYQQFISDLTIHTTSWFRERPHYDLVVQHAQDFIKNNKGLSKTLKIWSVACSTGEEVYSAALCLEPVVENNSQTFDYRIDASDIDLVSINKAKKCIYPESQINQIPKDMIKNILIGQNKCKGYFTLDSKLREKVKFFNQNISDATYLNTNEKYDIIICRNVLIYFSIEKQKEIIDRLVHQLNPGGIIILGHCDSFPNHSQLKAIGRSSFRYEHIVQPKIKIKKNIMIVDDSSTIRAKIKKMLECDDYRIYEAASTAEADNILTNHNIHFITLDLNMPGEDGASWLTKLRKNKVQIPTVIISDSQPEDAQRVFGALSAGAHDYIVKSKLHTEPQILVDLVNVLTTQEEKNKTSEIKLRPFTVSPFSPEVVVVGASTGGPEALVNLFKKLPAHFPPVVIVQHIGVEFSAALKNRLCEVSGLFPGEISSVEPLKKGHLYFATGDYHLQLKAKQNKIYIDSLLKDKIEGHRPSVDVLFESAAKIPADCLAILLTGMGKDGAAGLLKLVDEKKCYSLVQDASSSVVFGMPDKAIKLGAAHFVGNLKSIRAEMMRKLNISENYE